MILDTNAFSALADGDEALLAQIEGALQLSLPVIVLGEFRFGISKSRYRRTYEVWLQDALDSFTVLPVLGSTTQYYANVRRDLKDSGTPIPANDVWIAALSREHALRVVSRDRHFDCVPGLRRVDW